MIKYISNGSWDLILRLVNLTNEISILIDASIKDGLNEAKIKEFLKESFKIEVNDIYDKSEICRELAVNHIKGGL